MEAEQIERSLIGSCLTYEGLIYFLSDYLTPKTFVNADAREVFTIMQGIARQFRPVLPEEVARLSRKYKFLSECIMVAAPDWRAPYLAVELLNIRTKWYLSDTLHGFHDNAANYTERKLFSEMLDIITDGEPFEAVKTVIQQLAAFPDYQQKFLSVYESLQKKAEAIRRRDGLDWLCKTIEFYLSYYEHGQQRQSAAQIIAGCAERIGAAGASKAQPVPTSQEGL